MKPAAGAVVAQSVRGLHSLDCKHRDGRAPTRQDRQRNAKRRVWSGTGLGERLLRTEAGDEPRKRCQRLRQAFRAGSPSGGQGENSEQLRPGAISAQSGVGFPLSQSGPQRA